MAKTDTFQDDATLVARSEPVANPDQAYESGPETEPVSLAPGAATLSVQCFSSFDSAEKTWRSLEAHGHGAVYQRFDWCKIWFESFAFSLGAQPVITIIEIDGTPAMLLPLYTTTNTLGMRQAMLMGNRHANIRQPLTTTNARACAALADHARSGKLAQTLRKRLRQLGLVDYLYLANMVPSFDGEANFLFELTNTSSTDCAFIGALDSPFDRYVRDQRGGVYLKKHRKKWRALENLGEVTFSKVSDAHAASQTMDVFFRQKRDRLHEIKLDNAFNLVDDRDFVRRLAEYSAAHDANLLELYTLSVGEEVIAIFAGGRFGTAFSGAINSMDTRELYLKRSPGEIILHHVIEHLCDEGICSFDLGIGEASYKHSWTQPVVLRSLMMPITVSGYALEAKQLLKTKVRSWILANARTASLARRLKYYIKKRVTRL